MEPLAPAEQFIREPRRVPHHMQACHPPHHLARTEHAEMQTGREAARALSRGRIDAVLFDTNMPIAYLGDGGTRVALDAFLVAGRLIGRSRIARHIAANAAAPDSGCRSPIASNRTRIAVRSIGQLPLSSPMSTKLIAPARSSASPRSRGCRGAAAAIPDRHVAHLFVSFSWHGRSSGPHAGRPGAARERSERLGSYALHCPRAIPAPRRSDRGLRPTSRRRSK